MKLGGVLVSSLLSMLPGSLCEPEPEELRRVKAGQEYSLPTMEERRGRGLHLGNSIEEEEYRDCRTREAGVEMEKSLHQFTTEDIEKQNNVSLADYKGQVLLVVNLASF